MKDENSEVIYVGKAKNLKNRVNQYFSGKIQLPKVQAMVDNIQDFEYIITETELEALILECNLIKRYSPKYNILLKDDKGYPYICITSEAFPKIKLARRMKPDKSKYYGPYVNSTVARQVIDILKKVFNIRDCNRNLPRDIKKSRPCLNYHIHMCDAPCNAYISKDDYNANIKDIYSFLDGNYKSVTENLTDKMRHAADMLEFERAARFRDRIEIINNLQERQRITSTKQDNKDIVGLYRIVNHVCFQVFFIRDGKTIGRDHFFVKAQSDDTNIELMTNFIKQYYTLKSQVIPKKIYLSCEIEDKDLTSQYLTQIADEKIELIVPKRGDNLKLIDLATSNAKEALEIKNLEQNKYKRRLNTILNDLKNALALEKDPVRIESYDISNISGADNIGVCVVFNNALPQKSAYRKFNIKTHYQIDDYASMREVVERRLHRALDGDEKFLPLPDLILVDGGRGHVSSIRAVVTELGLNIPVFGLVKDDKHTTRALTTEHDEIEINRTSQLFKFLTRMQDEVHRFAINTHHSKHKRTSFNSTLTKIDGVGEATAKKLLRHFKSIAAIKSADIIELEKIVSRKIANNVHNHFKNV
jgi:excinuclease ABC subunit C